MVAVDQAVGTGWVELALGAFGDADSGPSRADQDAFLAYHQG